MTSRLRLLAAAGAVAVAALALLPPASAPAQVEPGPIEVPEPSDPRWGNGGEKFRYFIEPEVPEVVNDRAFVVGGYFEYDPADWRLQSRLDRVVLKLDAGTERNLPDGCPLEFTDDELGVPEDGGALQVGQFGFSLAQVCNAVYTMTLQAFAEDQILPPVGSSTSSTSSTTSTTDPDNPLDPVMSDEIVIENITVAVKPPEVGQVTATYADGTVALTWSAPIGYGPGEAPADFIGYRVVRALPDGEFETVATDTDRPPRLAASDKLPAGAVGEIRYQVQAARPLPDGTCCLGSDTGPTASATVTVDSPVTGPPTTIRRSSRTSGRRSTASTRPAAPVVDEGFEETLDFDDFEPGEDEALPPTGNVLEDSGDDDSAQEGVLVPAATASVLAVWAMHLRYLSRRAGDVL